MPLLQLVVLTHPKIDHPSPVVTPRKRVTVDDRVACDAIDAELQDT